MVPVARIYPGHAEEKPLWSAKRPDDVTSEADGLRESAARVGDRVHEHHIDLCDQVNPFVGGSWKTFCMIQNLQMQKSLESARS